MKAILDGESTEDIDELKKWILENRLNVYHGYDETSSAFVYSYSNHLKSIKIIYDDIYDCKRTELQLASICPKFYPRKFKVKKRKTIGVSQETLTELDKLRGNAKSYEMVIWKLILEHHEKQI